MRLILRVYASFSFRRLSLKGRVVGEQELLFFTRGYTRCFRCLMINGGILSLCFALAFFLLCVFLPFLFLPQVFFQNDYLILNIGVSQTPKCTVESYFKLAQSPVNFLDALKHEVDHRLLFVLAYGVVGIVVKHLGLLEELCDQFFNCIQMLKVNSVANKELLRCIELDWLFNLILYSSFLR